MFHILHIQQRGNAASCHSIKDRLVDSSNSLMGLITMLLEIPMCTEDLNLRILVHTEEFSSAKPYGTRTCSTVLQAQKVTAIFFFFQDVHLTFEVSVVLK